MFFSFICNTKMTVTISIKMQFNVEWYICEYLVCVCKGHSTKCLLCTKNLSIFVEVFKRWYPILWNQTKSRHSIRIKFQIKTEIFRPRNKLTVGLKAFYQRQQYFVQHEYAMLMKFSKKNSWRPHSIRRNSIFPSAPGTIPQIPT